MATHESFKWRSQLSDGSMRCSILGGNFGYRSNLDLQPPYQQPDYNFASSKHTSFYELIWLNIHPMQELGLEKPNLVPLASSMFKSLRERIQVEVKVVISAIDGLWLSPFMDGAHLTAWLDDQDHSPSASHYCCGVIVQKTLMGESEWPNLSCTVRLSRPRICLHLLFVGDCTKNMMRIGGS